MLWEPALYRIVWTILAQKYGVIVLVTSRSSNKINIGPQHVQVKSQTATIDQAASHQTTPLHINESNVNSWEGLIKCM